jgi:hypothetical protein
MKNRIFTLSIFFLCLFVNQGLNAQKTIQKATNNAIANNSKTGKYYIAKISEKKNLETEVVKNYCKDKYAVRNIRTKDRQVFGAFRTIVVSFEFRDLKEIRQEKIAEEKRRKEFAEAEKKRKERETLAVEKRKKELEAAEKLRNEKERIALEEARKNNVRQSKINSNTIDKFKNYGYDFKVSSKTILPKELFLTDSKTDPFIILNIQTNEKMYMIGVDDKGSQEITFDCYNVTKENQSAYYLHGFNQVTQKKEHFLLEPGASMCIVTNLTIAPNEPLVMYKSNKYEFEKLLGVSDLNGISSQNDYPKITKLSEGIWGKTKVELREDLYYIIDNHWDYNKDLSCYDRCYSCGFFGGKSDKEVDVKRLSIYCQGKLLGKFLIKDVSACHRRFYSHNGSNTFRDSEFNSKSDAITDLINIKSKECIEGNNFLTVEEKQQNLMSEKANKNHENGKYRRVVPNKEDFDLLVNMNISVHELTEKIWRLDDGLSYQFNTDGTIIFKTSNHEYIDTWRLTDDSTRIEIELHPPYYDSFFNTTFIHCSIVTIVKEDSMYFLYRADTPKGVGNCIKCPLQKLNK